MTYASSGNIYNSYFKPEKKGAIFSPALKIKVQKNPFKVISYLVLCNHFLLYGDHLEKQKRI